MTSPPFFVDVQTYAHVLARLAHRFGDRGAVLEVRGLDEERLEALERRVMHGLHAASAGGDLTALATFARELLVARGALSSVDVEPATVGPATIERRADPLPAPTPRASAPEAAATMREPDDLLDLMETLHSSSAGSRRQT